MDIKTTLENNLMKYRLLCFLICSLPCLVFAEIYVTIIQGLDGSPKYHQQFSEQAEKLRVAAETVTSNNRVKFMYGDDATRDNILSFFQNLSKSTNNNDRIAVFMIGHGSFDGIEYKFNIPGPDITAEDIVTIMDEQPAGIQLLVNTSSASGVLNNGLKKDSRVLITATRSGNERLATRFGAYFFDAFEDPSADINKNNAITAQEAFDYAEREVKDYFEYEGQLATEHSVISGDYAGQFVLARIGLDNPSSDDPELVGLIRQRDDLDIKLEDLQLRKSELEAGDFLNQLQQLMIDLSLVQEKIDELAGDNN